MSIMFEFAGLPGVGKSTLVKRVCKTLELTAPIRLLGEQPNPHFDQCFQHIEEILRPNQNDIRPIYKFASQCAQARICEKSPEPIILEEGLIHHLWRLVFLHPYLMDRDLEQIISSTHPIILFHTDIDTLYKRVCCKFETGTRGIINRRLYQSRPPNKDWRWAEISFARILQIVETRVIQFDTSGEITTVVPSLINLIENILNRPAVNVQS